MKEYKTLVIIFALCGCVAQPQTDKSFKLKDYSDYCPSEGRLKIPQGIKTVVRKEGKGDFYILPGDYIVSKHELDILPQNKKNSSGDFAQGITDYFTGQGEELKKAVNQSLGFYVFPTEIKYNFPDKSLAKELVVEKYVAVDNKDIVFCGLTLKSEYHSSTMRAKKYYAWSEKGSSLSQDPVYSDVPDGDKIIFSPYR